MTWNGAGLCALVGDPVSGYVPGPRDFVKCSIDHGNILTACGGSFMNSLLA